TRHGRERHAAPQTSLPTVANDAVYRAAGPLGLLATAEPTLGMYDVAAVLGGTAKGNAARTRYVTAAIRRGLRVRGFLGLGAPRPLDDAEADAEPSAADFVTEVEHLVAVMCDSAPSDLPLDVLTVPSTRPGRRADTADAARHLVAMTEPGDR